MPNEPQIELMPMHKRRRMFWLLALIFVIALPTLIFYTSGNRLDFSDDETSIVSVGGIYLNSDLEDVDVYLDEEPLVDRRIFRQAFYLQNITAGVHQVHVQSEGVATWVKQLPIYPHIVTEAEAFNMPLVPQVRVISEYETPGGQSVVFVPATTTPVLEHASSTNPFLRATSTATSTYLVNTEYVFVSELFATTSATTSESFLDLVTEGIDEALTFSDATTSVSSSTAATTSKTFRDMKLYEASGEVYATWIGSTSDVPHYFCVTYNNASTTAAEYGEHVAVDIQTLASTTKKVFVPGSRVCRETISIDRIGQEVVSFDFLPGRNDLVVLLLTDGVYVTEIDDRGWQNVQQLYPGENLELVIDGGQIYIKDDSLLLEVFTQAL